MRLSIKIFTKEDVLQLVKVFAVVNWPKPQALFDTYLEEQDQAQRVIWIGFLDNKVAGYVTLKWQSEYRYFRDQDIPEIMDLNVLPDFRNQGVGSSLLARAEETARQKKHVVGLGVGLYAGYGSAQRLYVKNGYIPDGQGATYRYQPIQPGDSVPLDDDFVLWLIKKL